MTQTPIGRLLDWMRDSGINQTELAKRMDSSPQDVTNWKSRGLPADQYAKAADAFGRSEQKRR